MNFPRVLVLHNHYQEAGGEDTVFAAECELLRANGHEVIEYIDSNSALKSIPRLTAARETIWSPRSYEAVRALIARTEPSIAHFHNTFVRISPSAYDACAEAGVPVVQSLHNYRLRCPAAVFYRDGHVCEDCRALTVAWPAVVHACYRDSRAQSFVTASMLAFHQLQGTWSERVDAYITCTDFARRKLIEPGLPPQKVFVKPNFSDIIAPLANASRDFALYCGRLSVEKGVDTLLQAWKRLDDVPLRIAGDGPLAESVRAFAAAHSNVRYDGLLARSGVLERMQHARFNLYTSRMYEVFPMTIVEGFANGLAVIASRRGAASEIVRDGEIGILFEPGDAAALAASVRKLWDHPQECARLGDAARAEHRAKYTPPKNYELLMDIYSHAQAARAA